MDLGPFGFAEIVFIGLLALVVFGPRRLPEIGHVAGRAVAKLKRAAQELRSAYESELDAESREQIRAAGRGLSEVKDTIESAGRDLLRESGKAGTSVRSAADDARRAVARMADSATDGAPKRPETGAAGDDDAGRR